MTSCARCGAELSQGARFCSSCGAAVAQGGLQAPVRKHVVILFCDIVGSTSLGEAADPEALRERLARYFDAVSQVIWAHGGTVEKFIGDAVMAVFGVPSTREDDAARAVRAAIGIHEAVGGLSEQFEREIGTPLHVRIGINSGEVFVTHQPDGQFSVTGDAVNTAQRLEAAAATDETYVGDTVAQLVTGQLALDDVGEILHKGKTLPQQVFRVANDQDRDLEVREPAFVGRTAELADLTALAERSARRRQGWLLTYVGDAGIGKSRLIRQFATGRDGLRVVVGRCDAMSSGAFAPLGSWLRSLADDWQLYVEELLDAGAVPVLQRLRSAVGLSDAQTSTDDVVWAVHQVLVAMCEATPVASVWDDLHSATESQLDFLGRLATASRTLPVLTVCLARPELFDIQASWGGGRKSRVEDVEPLDFEDMLAIAAERIALQASGIDVTAEDLVNRADGNPQVVQLLAQSAAAGEALPASVAQLYEAALDRLAADERGLVEVAAVYGRHFPVAPVAAVADIAEPTGVVDRLRGRNVLEIARDGSYRFSQTAFMQTAYRTMPKRTRITQHSAIAEWTDKHRGELSSDAVAVIASHRKRAFDLVQEIDGSPSERADLQRRAADSALESQLASQLRALAAAAAMESLLTMQLRGDPGQADAIDRLLAVLPAGDPRHFEAALAGYFLRNRIDPARWAVWLDRIDAALAADLTWQAIRGVCRHWAAAREGELSLEETRAEAQQALARLHALPDADPIATEIVEIDLAQAEADLGNLAACHQISVAGVTRAQRQGRVYTERTWRSFDIQVAYAGQTPLADVIADAETLQGIVSGQRHMWRTTTAVLAGALSASGEVERARSLWKEVDASIEGVPLDQRAYDLQHYPFLLLVEGRPADAARYWSERATETGVPSFVAGLLGSAARDAIFAGDLAYAVDAGRRLDAVDLPATLALAGDANRAWLLAAQAALRGDRVAAFEQTALAGRLDRPEESPVSAAYLHAMTAIVEHLLGDDVASSAAADRARDAFERKGAVALRDQVDTWVGNADKLRVTGG